FETRVDVAASRLGQQTHRLGIAQDVHGEGASPRLAQGNQRLAKLLEVTEGASKVVVREDEGVVKQTEMVFVETHPKFYFVHYILHRPATEGLETSENTETA